MTAAKTPIITAPVALTNPQAGVITTRPATAPLQKPNTLALPRRIFSIMPQVNAPTAVASVVVVNALEDITSAATALPALKPYHPTQSIEVPIIHKTMLWGGIGSFLNPKRGPSSKQRTKELHPEVIWTTVPPAKSIALMPEVGFQIPFMKPVIPHTMWAIGK